MAYAADFLRDCSLYNLQQTPDASRENLRMQVSIAAHSSTSTDDENNSFWSITHRIQPSPLFVFHNPIGPRTMSPARLFETSVNGIRPTEQELSNLRSSLDAASPPPFIRLRDSLDTPPPYHEPAPEPQYLHYTGPVPSDSPVPIIETPRPPSGVIDPAAVRLVMPPHSTSSAEHRTQVNSPGQPLVQSCVPSSH